MSFDFTIVEAQAADVPEILNLIRGLADYEKLSHEVVATEESLQAALFTPGAHAHTLLARTSTGETIGFALYFYNFSTFLARKGIYLEDLFVRPQFRGKGVGKALLQALILKAGEEDCGRVEWSVLDWNAPAIAFYEKLGARVLPEWRVCRLAGEALDHAVQLANKNSSL